MKKDHVKDRYLINSILRACNILKSFSREKSYFKISELAELLQIDRSTIYRLLLSLEKCGLVEKDKRTGEYTLGMTAFEIGNSYLRRMDFIQISKPIMADLALKVQETVHLAVLSDIEIVYVEKSDSPRTLGVMSKIGQRAPVYCTALGKVLLAHQPEDDQLRISKEVSMRAFTENTLTSRERLMEELREIRQQGYSFDRREYEEEVECIAAPIRDHLGSVIAAISISGPQRKIGAPNESHFVNQVVEGAALISSKMGYRKGSP